MNNIVHLEFIKKEVGCVCMHFYVNVSFLRQCRYDVGMHIASITLLLHHEIMIFFYKNDRTHREDNDEQYYALGIHQKGVCGDEICIFTSMSVFYVNVGMMSVCILRQSHYCYTMRS